MRDGLLPYNKNTEDKRRPLIMVSPRERQIKVQAEALAHPIIKDLSARLEKVTEELLGIQGTSGYLPSGAKLYTEGEFNDKLTEALTKEMEVMGDIVTVKAEVVELQKQVEIKDALIQELKTLKITTTGGPIVETLTDPDRPTMDDTIVIDPTEPVELEAYIDIAQVDDETTSDKSEVEDKLAKLKELGLGG